jgi:O-antigen ligase
MKIAAERSRSTSFAENGSPISLLAWGSAGLAASVLLAYVYVLAFGVGFRAVFVLNAGAALFLAMTLFLNRLHHFLLVLVVVCIPLQFGYHIVHEPLEDVESQPFMTGIIIDSVDVVLLALYARWTLLRAAHRDTRPLTMGKPVGTLLITWILYGLVSSYATAVNWRYSFYECFALFKGFLLYLYLVNNLRTKQDVNVIVYALFGATVVHALYIIGQFVTGLNYTLHGELQSYVGPEGFRSIGFFGSPDAASALMSIIIPVALAWLIVTPRGALRRLILASVFIVIIAILCTKVRAAGFAVVISSSLVFIIAFAKGRISSRQFSAALLTATLCLILVSPMVVHRFLVGTRGEDRLPLAVTAIKMFSDHRLFGIGPNNYTFRIDEYLPTRLRYSWKYVVHNDYLLRLAESGVVGFVIYYALLLAVMRRLWRLRGSRDPLAFGLSVGLFSAMAGSLPHRIFSSYHYINLFNELCVVYALTTVLDRMFWVKTTMSGFTEGPDGLPGEGVRADAIAGSEATGASTSGRRALALLAALGVVLFHVAVVEARTLHVDGRAGDDCFGGEEGAPFRTIGKASEIAIPGDVVLIREGVYHEQIMGGRSGLPGAPITYRGVDREKVVLRGSVHVNDWVRSGAVWTKRGLAPITHENAFVMVDDKLMLKKVGRIEELSPGAFHLSREGVFSLRLPNDANPNKDHKVDVYELDFAFNAGNRWGGTAKRRLILKDLTIEKYGTYAISTDWRNPDDNGHWELDGLIVRLNREEGVFHCLNDWHVHHCVFERNGVHGCQINGSRVLFEYNVCRENEWFGPSPDGGCGLLIGPDAQARSCVIRRNLFESNGAAEGYGCAVYLEGRASGAVIEQNVIRGGASSGVAFFGSSDNRVMDNVLIDVANDSDWERSGAFVWDRSYEGEPSLPTGNVVRGNTVIGCSAPVSVWVPAGVAFPEKANLVAGNFFAHCRWFRDRTPQGLAVLEGNFMFECPESAPGGDGGSSLKRSLKSLWRGIKRTP